MAGLVVALLSVVLQTASQGAIVRGQVVGASTGLPVSGVLVAISDLDRDVRSDAQGRFEFLGVPVGRHVLTASLVGYAFARRPLDVAAGAPLVELTVPLTEGTGAYQETVTVSASAGTGSAPGVSAAREAGSATLQDLRGVAADDPMRAVQALPGVVTGDDFQSEFSVRGSAFRHVGVVLDGAEAPALLHSVRGADDTGSVAMINTDVLNRATLLSGAHPRRYGDWLGATLEFDVREGSRDRLAVRAAVSGTSASSVVDGPLGRGGRGSWLVSVRKSYIDWLIRKLEPDIDSTIGFADGLGKIVYDLGAGQQVQVLVAGGDAVYRERDTAQANGILRATSGSTLASATWRLTRERWWVVQRVTFYGADFHNVGRLGQQLARGYSQSVGWHGQAATAFGDGWTLEAGGSSRKERMNQILREFNTVRPGVVRQRAAREVTASFIASNAWVHVARDGAAGHLAFGLRGSAHDAAPKGVLQPWVLAEHRSGAWTWRASAGRSAQFADPALAAAAGEVAPAERATHLDLGIEHRLTDTMRWSATAFGRRDTDVRRRIGEPRLDPVTGARIAADLFPTYASRLDGTTEGIDLLISRRAATGLTGWASYTYGHTRHHDRATGESFDGDFDQRHTLNVFAQQRVSYRLALSAKLRIGSNVPLVGYFEETPGDLLKLSARRNQVRLPVYARLDLRATRTFAFDRRRVTLFAEIMNALGRRNLRQSEASIRSTTEAVSYAERLMPFVPSLGILIEF